MAKTIHGRIVKSGAVTTPWIIPAFGERFYVMRKHGKDWVSTRWDYADSKKEADKMVKRWGLRKGQFKIVRRIAP